MIELRTPDPPTSRHPRLFRSLAAVVLILAALGAATPAPAQEEATGSALAAAGGGIVGLVAGGYTNLAIVVLKTRYGIYPHSFRDAFGWESAPILIGGGAGVAIGLVDRDLVIPWIIGGSAGLAAGAGLGMLYGEMAWGDPESRWANAAVGAAIGMVLGSTVALIREWDEGEDAAPSDAAAVRVPLITLGF
jgi:hypothetical protein